MINDEVKELLMSGQAYEKNLVKLERKLRAAIECDRRKAAEDDLHNAHSDNRSVAPDQQSVRSEAPSGIS